jgi:hypothetical protein
MVQSCILYQDINDHHGHAAQDLSTAMVLDGNRYQLTALSLA